MPTLVLCPTRGRPGAAREAYQSFLDTREAITTAIEFVVDDDDVTLDGYLRTGIPVRIIPSVGSMNAALNKAARLAMAENPWGVFGFIGDDHRFRTDGWDVAIEDHLRKAGGGIAYGDDLLQRINLPTVWFVSRSIVEVFGMGLPELRHLWIDNYWKELGEAAGCLYYFPDIVIEHMHPAAGKAVMDAGYERVNSGAMIEHDQAAFVHWQQTQMAADVETLRQLVK